MAEKIRSRQHQILQLLLENKAGLSIDEIATASNISRNAVQQHFAVLERDGYIQTGVLNKTAGRPVRSFVLTEAGINSFPKQYVWFSELILSDLQQEMGAERFKDYMQRLGLKLADKLRRQFEGKNLDERMDEMVSIMANLGFQVTAGMESETGKPIIQANNCIYHDLAQKYKEICEFDLALMSSLLRKEVRQLSCMAKGDCACRFRVQEKQTED